MDLFAGVERLRLTDDRAWTRHGKPWSVRTRFAALPLLVLAVWSRAWSGWWSLLAVAAAGTWIRLNPRAFPPPAEWDRRASRATLGERVCLARGRFTIPKGALP